MDFVLFFSSAVSAISAVSARTSNLYNFTSIYTPLGLEVNAEVFRSARGSSPPLNQSFFMPWDFFWQNANFSSHHFQILTRRKRFASIEGASSGVLSTLRRFFLENAIARKSIF